MIGSIAFDKMADEDDVRTMMGVSPEQAAEFMARTAATWPRSTAAPASTWRMAARIVRRYRAACGLPVMVQPNAGQPVLEDMKVVYKETPEEMARGPARPSARRARASWAAAAAARPPTSAASARSWTPAARGGHESTIPSTRRRPSPPARGDKPDGSGVGVNYADADREALKQTLPDGRKLLLKRRGLKLTLASATSRARR